MPNQPRRLLIVDDNLDLLVAMRRVLRVMPEVEVRTATSVDEALATVAQWRPHLVLTDYDLRSERTGLDLAQQLWHSGARVVLMTGLVTAELRERAAVVDVEVLAKPIDVKAEVERLLAL